MKKKGLCWRAIWPWFLVALWYVLIVWFSAQPGFISEAQSQRVERIAGGDTLLSLPVRKWGHVVLFFMLGYLSHRALRVSARTSWRRLGGWRALLAATGLCAVLGALDELHQHFVPERAALIGDVAVDTLSALLGALVYAGLVWLLRRRRR